MEQAFIIRATIMEQVGARRYRESGVWREIVLSGDATLFDLAKAILASVHFDTDHLFMFTDTTDFWGETSKVRYEFNLFIQFPKKGPPLRRIFTRKGEKLFMLFDYGDEWVFKVKLVGFETLEKSRRYPYVKNAMGEDPAQYPKEDK